MNYLLGSVRELRVRSGQLRDESSGRNRSCHMLAQVRLLPVFPTRVGSFSRTEQSPVSRISHGTRGIPRRPVRNSLGQTVWRQDLWVCRTHVAADWGFPGTHLRELGISKPGPNNKPEFPKTYRQSPEPWVLARSERRGNYVLYLVSGIWSLCGTWLIFGLAGQVH